MRRNNKNKENTEDNREVQRSSEEKNSIGENLDSWINR